MNKPSKDDWIDWKNSPVTQWVKEELELMRLQYQEDMGRGAVLDINSLERTALLTAQNVGFIDGITALQRLALRDDES